MLGEVDHTTALRQDPEGHLCKGAQPSCPAAERSRCNEHLNIVAQVVAVCSGFQYQHYLHG